MKKIEKFYNDNYENEWQRLENHKIEFEVTKKILLENINENATILDLGGGPGRYSLFLAEKGHKVTLFDLSENNLELAKKKAEELNIKIEKYVSGNALDLSMFDDNSFDYVLNMGPMYHITNEKDRKDCINESLRVLKKRGIIFISFISNYAPIIDMLKKYPEKSSIYLNEYLGYLKNGEYVEKDSEKGFTDAYFIYPQEINSFMQNFYVRTLHINALEALAVIKENEINQLSKEDFNAWVNLIYQIGQDPITWGASEHFLYTGMKI